MDFYLTTCLSFLIELGMVWQTLIVIAWDEFKPVLHPEYFWEQWYIYLLCARVELKALHHGWGLCQNFFKEFRVTTLSEQ